MSLSLLLLLPLLLRGGRVARGGLLLLLLLLPRRRGSQAAVERPGRGRATEARWSALLLLFLPLLLLRGGLLL